MQVTSYLYPCLLYAKGDKYLDFFLFLPGRKDCSRVRFFLFLFLRVYPASTPALSSPAFEKKFFFSFFLFGRTTTTLPPWSFFIIIITKVKLLQGWSLICLFLNLKLNVNLNVELNLNLNLTKAPLADIQVGKYLVYLSRITYIYIVVSKGACLIETQQYSIV